MKLGTVTGSFVGAAALVLVLSACGSSRSTASDPTVSGVATGKSLDSVVLKDSSNPAREKSVGVDSAGRFSIDVAGLTPPFLLRVVPGSGAYMYGVAEEPGTADIDPVTSTAVALASSDGSADDAWSAADGAALKNFPTVLQQIQTTLAVLFQHYGVTFDDSREQSSAFQTMLSQVGFGVNGGMFTVSSLADGKVIFTSPVQDLSSGTFYAQNLPGGIAFEKDVDPIFTRVFSTIYAPGTCYSCHSKGLPTSDAVPFTFTSPANPATDYQTIISTGLVDTSTPATSLLYLKPTGQVTHGGNTVFPSSSPEAQVILTWIQNGALGPSGATPPPTPPPGSSQVTQADVVASCTGCHGLTSNTTVFMSGGYTETGWTSAQWLSAVNDMMSNKGAQLAAGTTAQNYADYLAGVP